MLTKNVIQILHRPLFPRGHSIGVGSGVSNVVIAAVTTAPLFLLLHEPFGSGGSTVVGAAIIIHPTIAVLPLPH
jgi:hypothetical protein